MNSQMHMKGMEQGVLCAMDAVSRGLRQVILMKKPMSMYTYKLLTTENGGRIWRSVDVASLLFMWVVLVQGENTVWGIFRSQEDAERAVCRAPNRESLSTPAKTAVKGNLNVGSTNGSVQVELQICGEHVVLLYDGVMLCSVDGGQHWFVSNPCVYVGISSEKTVNSLLLLYVSESYESVPYRGLCWHRYVSVPGSVTAVETKGIESESESENEYEYEYEYVLE